MGMMFFYLKFMECFEKVQKSCYNTAAFSSGFLFYNQTFWVMSIIPCQTDK